MATPKKVQPVVVTTDTVLATLDPDALKDAGTTVEIPGLTDVVASKSTGNNYSSAQAIMLLQWVSALGAVTLSDAIVMRQRQSVKGLFVSLQIEADNRKHVRVVQRAMEGTKPSNLTARQNLVWDTAETKCVQFELGDLSVEKMTNVGVVFHKYFGELSIAIEAQLREERAQADNNEPTTPVGEVPATNGDEPF